MSENKVVLISGGSKGLGQGLVRRYLQQGFTVGTFSRNTSAFIESTQNEFSDRFRFEALDILDTDSVNRFVNRLAKQYGRLDILINNAGVLVESLLPMTRPDDIHRILSLNLEGAIQLSRSCSRHMLRQNSGVILNISSLNGVRGHKGVSVYSATKAALDGFSRSLARELGPRGIRVNSLAPGYFESDLSHTINEAQKAQILRRTPLQRFGTVEDMVDVAYFLTSDASRFITGQTIVVDGGITC